jgi:hypothetical protein
MRTPDANLPLTLAFFFPSFLDKPGAAPPQNAVICELQVGRGEFSIPSFWQSVTYDSHQCELSHRLHCHGRARCAHNNAVFEVTDEIPVQLNRKGGTPWDQVLWQLARGYRREKFSRVTDFLNTAPSLLRFPRVVLFMVDIGMVFQGLQVSHDFGGHP